IELNPNYATAHQWYALYLVSMGRASEAASEITLAQRLDPLSMVISTTAAQIMLYARRYDDALEQCRKVFELYGGFAPAHFMEARAYEEKGRYPQALAEFEKADTLAGSSPAMRMGIARAYALSGDKGKAREELGVLLALSRQRYVPALYIMAVYAGLDDKDRAFEWLKRALDDRSDYLVYLEREPGLDNLRSDRRFSELVRPIGLPP
ncbi:MAG TPA: tetratricopeptide repeat protein, partial [Terriglobia bacterium]|nr:tetratricopeptide repeat protein [Terriglobia bacterium]